MNFGFLAAIFFPAACAVCRKSVREGALCATCRARIVRSRRMPGPPVIYRPSPYHIGAAGKYTDLRMKTLIHELKFNRLRVAAEPLGELLAEYFAKANIRAERYTVMPIPLSRKREAARGFNQAELIARHFAKQFGCTVDAESLVRIKHARPQSETENLAERRANIRGVFEVRHGDRVTGRDIILIDDVTTSGATFAEAVHSLKNAGARKVIALAAAQA